MDTSTWTAVVIGGVMMALTLAVFGLSLVPPTVRATWLPWLRSELASWPEQWRGLRGDAAALLRRGRHAGSPASPPPLALQVAQDDVTVIRDDSATTELPMVTVEPLEVPERTDAGATEDWSPMAEVEAVEDTAPGISAAHTPPDMVERTLLADFDAIVADLRAVPKDLVAFAEVVDASMAQAGMDGESHRRWRATAFDVPTGEFRMALAG